MPSTGATLCGTGQSVTRGATAWATPGNITANDGTRSDCNSGASGSDYLVARNFGFAISAGATILGVEVVGEFAENSAGTESLNAQLQNETATLVGASKAAVISGTTLTDYTFGGSSDLWSATLTPTIVNDVDFGVRFWFTTTHNVGCDKVTMNITYSDGYGRLLSQSRNMLVLNI